MDSQVQPVVREADENRSIYEPFCRRFRRTSSKR
jgi:hypothetical protein